jgi:hypothetical protein
MPLLLRVDAQVAHRLHQNQRLQANDYEILLL